MGRVFLQFCLLLVLFINLFNGYSNYVLSTERNDNKLNGNHVTDNPSKRGFESNIADFYDILPDAITNEQRINLCKSTCPQFRSDKLKPDDIEELSRFGITNPCRVDCVVYEDRDSTIKRVTYTQYFKDGKTNCNPNKVCMPQANVGVCKVDPASYDTSTIIDTTTTTTITPKPTSTTSNPTTTTITTTTTTTTTKTTPSTTTTATTTPTTTITTTTTTTEASSTKSFRNKECPFEGFFRDPSDPECRKFYRCVSVTENYFKKMDMGTCSPDTVFDEQLNSCQHEYLTRQPCPKHNP